MILLVIIDWRIEKKKWKPKGGVPLTYQTLYSMPLRVEEKDSNFYHQNGEFLPLKWWNTIYNTIQPNSVKWAIMKVNFNQYTSMVIRSHEHMVPACVCWHSHVFFRSHIKMYVFSSFSVKYLFWHWNYLQDSFMGTENVLQRKWTLGLQLKHMVHGYLLFTSKFIVLTTAPAILNIDFPQFCTSCACWEAERRRETKSDRALLQ